MAEIRSKKPGQRGIFSNIRNNCSLTRFFRFFGNHRMNLDWKLIRSIWVALLVPILIAAMVWAWPLGIERWEQHQLNKKIQACQSDMEQTFGRVFKGAESCEVFNWCSHRASGGLFDHTYKPIFPSLWKEYSRRQYPGTDPCKAHDSLSA